MELELKSGIKVDESKIATVKVRERLNREGGNYRLGYEVVIGLKSYGYVGAGWFSDKENAERYAAMLMKSRH